MSDFETRAGATDVMSTYPDEEEFDPTVALVDQDDEGTYRDAEASPDMPGREAEDVPADGEAAVRVRRRSQSDSLGGGRGP